jgi:hypothetical protein
MKVREQSVVIRGSPFRKYFFLSFLLFWPVITAGAQTVHPGRGAISAQDLAKLAAPAASGSDAADQVCARFASGSATTAPPELESQNGVLEVTFKLLTATDARGLVRYCYVTDTGLQSPTLRVNPGDQLIIHFQNNLPAVSASSASDNMAGMKMSLSSHDAATNGVNVGGPATLANGQATLTTPINGVTGSNDLTAFYQGDATYMESVSGAVPLTISNFAMSSPGVTAPLGSAAIAPVTVNVATNYTSPINFTCSMPSGLTQSACFVNPNSMTGTGKVSLTVNTTPAHPAVQRMSSRSDPGWFVAGGGVSLTCLFLFRLPRRRSRREAMILLTLTCIFLTAIGCGGTAQTNPGTAKGTYTVVVTGIAGSGSSQYQTSVNVPITIQ